MKQNWKILHSGLFLGATIAIAVAGCGSDGKGPDGKGPVTIDGKTYAYGDELEMSQARTEHFCGEVIDFSGSTFPSEHHFAIAASNPSRDCGAAVKFFHDFLQPGNSYDPGGFWRGMKINFVCGAYYSGTGGCPPREENASPGGFWAQTISGTNTPYSNAQGYDKFEAMAVAF